jgi:hypothetical protein
MNEMDSRYNAGRMPVGGLRTHSRLVMLWRNGSISWNLWPGKFTG